MSYPLQRPHLPFPFPSCENGSASAKSGHVSCLATRISTSTNVKKVIVVLRR